MKIRRCHVGEAILIGLGGAIGSLIVQPHSVMEFLYGFAIFMALCALIGFAVSMVLHEP